MAEKFTAKQREIVARKLGYDGPMQGFDNFINSSPALGMKYAAISDKFATRMAKGGMARKKFQAGGAVTAALPSNWSTFTPEQKVGYFNTAGVNESQLKSEGVPQSDIDYMRSIGYTGGTAPVGTTGTTLAGQPGSDVTVNAGTTGDDVVDIQVLVYGPDGTMYSSPSAARAAGVTNYTTSPPVNLAGQSGSNVTGNTGTGTGTETINMRTGVVTTGTTGSTGSTGTAASTTTPVTSALPSNWNTFTPEQKVGYFNTNRINENQLKSEGVPQADIDYMKSIGYNANPGGVTAGTTTADTTVGAPALPTAPTITAAQTSVTPGMTATAQQATAPTAAAPVTNVVAPTPVSLPKPIEAPTITAATAAPAITDVLTGLDAQQGVVSDAALATAATQAPETTAVAGVEAAQGVAGTVQGAPTRTVQEGEMVSGPAVDMARVEQTLAQTQAAQGTVTEDMTTQGQLNKLLTNFDAGNPPPWAAASMRAANAQMAARGIGASSMAGQAIIQATLEAATPIAAADAKVFETMGLQNLSNRQQTAMLVGQQRAAFLGQEFDQAFQTRVLNSARIADIANKNFDAQTQIAIENSRLANSMDIANLSAKNAVVMGKMAQMSQLETQNLSNRQQVAVENARAFLTMDIKNLDNRQQTALFRAQEMNDALISDAGFANAANVTNASNALDAAKVSAQLALSAETFNSDLLTKVNMTNALAANEISKFNAAAANAREEFNSNMVTQINLANAKILAEVSTANTAAVNAANAVNAKNATDLSAAAYAQQSQTYRDLLEMSWKTGESEKDRATQIVAATLSASASTNAAKTTADSSAISNIAKLGVTALVNYDKVKDSFSSLMGDLGLD